MKVLRFLIFIVISLIAINTIPEEMFSNYVLLAGYVLSAQMITLVILKKTSIEALTTDKLSRAKVILLVFFPVLSGFLARIPVLQLIVIGIYLAIFSPFEIKQV